MTHMHSKAVRGILLVAVSLGLATGCGTPAEEALEPTQDADLVSQEAAAEEDPVRKVEDLMAGLDHQEGILHVVDTSQDVALQQLQAVRVDGTYYQTTDSDTGEVTRFRVQTYPITRWPTLWKYCPGVNQWVPYWKPCPIKIFEDWFTRLWIHSSCSRKVQSAVWGACVNNSTGGSYQIQYLNALKCGVGTGICKEKRAVRSIQYNYSPWYCSGPLSSTTSYYDFLCKL